MKSKILFIVPYPFDTAPSQRLKFEQYYPAFKNEGYVIDVASFINRKFWKIIYKKGYYFTKFLYTIVAFLKRYWLLTRIGRYDIVYVHLWGTPFGLPIYEWLVNLLAKKVVYDIDDLIYKPSSSSNNKFINIFKSRAKIDFLMRSADHVLVSTDTLYSYAKENNNNVSIIPATIDVTKYNNKPLDNLATVHIGWSGSHTTSKYLHLLDGVLKKISNMYNVKILVMGDNDFFIDGVDIELLQWSAKDEIANLLKFDIGLHPLPDEEWIYGKSGGKLVQYLASGIPIIASALGPNFKVIEEGRNGYLVSTEDEWIEKLKTLIEDKQLRQQMGEHSRQLAIQKYSVEANVNKYLSVFEN